MFANLTVDTIADLTDHASFDRGQKIEPSRVEITQRNDEHIRATVTAPHEYHVRLDVEGTDIVALCDCAIEHEWCRHCVATALKATNSDGDVFTADTREAAASAAVLDDPIDTYITGLTREQLVDLVRDLRVAKPGVDLALEVGAAEHVGGAGAVGKRIAERVDRLKRKNPGWSARLTAEVAQEWFELLDVCSSCIDRGWGAELIRPLEEATDGIGQMLLRSDDTYGTLADAYRTAIILHLAAYRQKPPTPGEVVEWISTLVFDESGFGEPDLADYADWLDIQAIDEIERRLDKAVTHVRYDDSLEYLREGIARLRGDDIALEQMLAGDELLGFYEERGRDSDARDLLEEAVKERVSKKRLGLGGTGVSLEALTSRLDRYWGTGALLRFRKDFAKAHPGQGLRDLLNEDGVTREMAEEVVAAAPSWLRANLQLQMAMRFDDFDLGYRIATEHPRPDELDPELVFEMGTAIGVNVNRAKGTELMFHLPEHFAAAGDLPSYKRLEAELRDIRKFVADDAPATELFNKRIDDLRDRYAGRAAVREILERI